jgi:3-hydroxyisobutyrate dehydrogenase
MRVLVVGLGSMGQNLATRLQNTNKFKRVSVWNRTESVSKLHAAKFGTILYTNLSQGVDESDFVISILKNSKAVSAVLDSVHSSRSQGTLSHRGGSGRGLWIDATSGNPSETRENAAKAAATLSMRFIDCAVSGGPHGALNGSLMGFVGGDEDDIASAKPVLEQFTRDFFRFGPVGSGHAVKAVNNTLLAANLFLAGEALEMLAKQGVDVKVAAQAIAGGSGGSFVMSDRVPKYILNGGFNYGFSLSGLAKDVRNGTASVSAAVAHGTADNSESFTGLLAQVRALTDAAEHRLGCEADHTEIARLFKGLGL